jgi:hypothetical protein
LNKDTSETIDWEVLPDNVHITNCPLFENIKQKAQPRMNKTIDPTKFVASNFFDIIWPDVKGKAKMVDKYLSDPGASYNQTYISDRIKFHDDDAEDSDWKVKQCILVLVAAANELHCGDYTVK